MKTFDDLLNEYNEWMKTDPSIKKVLELPNEYNKAEMLSRGIGKKWGNMLSENYGQADYSQIVDELTKSLNKAYSETSFYSMNIQQSINEAAGIGMKAIRPRIDGTRIPNLLEKLIVDQKAQELAKNCATREEFAQAITKMCEEMNITDAERINTLANSYYRIIDAPAPLTNEAYVQSITKSAVVDTIEANARIQKKAGLHAYVERSGGIKCCDWCKEITGRYEYGEQPSDFWRVHDYCTCKFEYKPSKYAEISKIDYTTYKKDGKTIIKKNTQ